MSRSRAMHLQLCLQELKGRERRAQEHNKQLLQQFEKAQDSLKEMLSRIAAMKTIRVHSYRDYTHKPNRLNVFFFLMKLFRNPLMSPQWGSGAETLWHFADGVWEISGGELPPLAAASPGENTGHSTQGAIVELCVFTNEKDVTRVVYFFNRGWRAVRGLI